MSKSGSWGDGSDDVGDAAILIVLVILLYTIPSLMLDGLDLAWDIIGPRPTTQQLPSEEGETVVRVVLRGGWVWPDVETIGTYSLGFYETAGEQRTRIRADCSKHSFPLYRKLLTYPNYEMTCVFSPRLPEGTYFYGGKWEKQRSELTRLFTHKRRVKREVYVPLHVK